MLCSTYNVDLRVVFFLEKGFDYVLAEDAYNTMEGQQSLVVHGLDLYKSLCF